MTSLYLRPGFTFRDLADINNDGCLTRDGFAVAMHLIQKKLAGKDVPVTLPPSLVPPSARVAVSTSSPFSPATQTQQPAVDLFSFDDTPPPSAGPTQTFSPPTLQAQYTGAFQVTPVKHTPEPDPFTAPSFDTCVFPFRLLTILIAYCYPPSSKS